LGIFLERGLSLCFAGIGFFLPLLILGSNPKCEGTPFACPRVIFCGSIVDTGASAAVFFLPLLGQFGSFLACA